MDSLSSMNNAMVYIEEHLTEDIDYSEVSKTRVLRNFNLCVLLIDRVKYKYITNLCFVKNTNLETTTYL